MMSVKKWMLILAVSAGVVIQFIRPVRNVFMGSPDQDISRAYTVPGKVYESLKRSCYDCHSSETIYPWYSDIQPLGWWLQKHVNKGRKELNFSNFASYSVKKQRHKLDEIVEMVKGEEMPLSSYLWIHREARLSDNHRKMLIEWAKDLREELANKKSSE